MTNEVFLDTAYAIALSVESDEHHEQAEESASGGISNRLGRKLRATYPTCPL